MADAQISLEEAERFESACKEYAQRIDEAVTFLTFLKSSVQRVGDTWRDADYETVCSMTEDIEREVAGALATANDEIIPYVSKKVATLKSK